MPLPHYSSGREYACFSKNKQFGVSKLHYMNNRQQATKIRQLQKDLAEQDAVNANAVKLIEELRIKLDEQRQFTAAQQENIALLKRLLALQAAVFTGAFGYMQNLQQRMQATIKDTEISPSGAS
jgi:hypothetical protein